MKQYGGNFHLQIYLHEKVFSSCCSPWSAGIPVVPFSPFCKSQSYVHLLPNPNWCDIFLCFHGRATYISHPEIEPDTVFGVVAVWSDGDVVFEIIHFLHSTNISCMCSNNRLSRHLMGKSAIEMQQKFICVAANTPPILPSAGQVDRFEYHFQSYSRTQAPPLAVRRFPQVGRGRDWLLHQEMASLLTPYWNPTAPTGQGPGQAQAGSDWWRSFGRDSPKKISVPGQPAATATGAGAGHWVPLFILRNGSWRRKLFECDWHLYSLSCISNEGAKPDQAYSLSAILFLFLFFSSWPFCPPSINTSLGRSSSKSKAVRTRSRFLEALKSLFGLFALFV